MDDTIPIMAIHRSRETILASIEAQRAIVTAHLDLAVKYHSLDLRPIVFAGGATSRVGPDPIPIQLREALDGETRLLAALEHELYEASRQEVQPDAYYAVS